MMDAITDCFRNIARLTAATPRQSGGRVLNQHRYVHDPARQRTRQYRADGSYVDYRYDGRGRVRRRVDYIRNSRAREWQISMSPGQWQAATEVRHIYFGILVHQEWNSSNTPTVLYTRDTHQKPPSLPLDTPVFPAGLGDDAREEQDPNWGIKGIQLYDVLCERAPCVKKGRH